MFEKDRRRWHIERAPLIYVLCYVIRMARSDLLGGDQSSSNVAVLQSSRKLDSEHKERDHGQFYMDSEFVTEGFAKISKNNPVMLCSYHDNKTVSFTCDPGYSIAVTRPYLLEADGVNCPLPKTCQELLKEWHDRIKQHRDEHLSSPPVQVKIPNKFQSRNDRFHNISEECREGLKYMIEYEFTRKLTKCNTKQICTFTVNRDEVYSNPLIMEIVGYPIVLVDHYRRHHSPFKCIKNKNEPGRTELRKLDVCKRSIVEVEPSNAIYIKSHNYPHRTEFGNNCTCLKGGSEADDTEIWIIHLEHSGTIRFTNRTFTANYLFQPILTRRAQFSMPEFFPQIETKGRTYKIWMIIENRNNYSITVKCGLHPKGPKAARINKV